MRVRVRMIIVILVLMMRMMVMNGRIMMMKTKRRSNQVDKGQNCDQTPFLILRFLRLAISHRLSHIT